MTADIRTAAQREAHAHIEAMRAARKYAPDDIEAQSDFACGYLVADRARVTPTREQIAEAIDEKLYGFPDGNTFDESRPYGIQEAEWAADAVLALMAGLAEGES